MVNSNKAHKGESPNNGPDSESDKKIDLVCGAYGIDSYDQLEEILPTSVLTLEKIGIRNRKIRSGSYLQKCVFFFKKNFFMQKVVTPILKIDLQLNKFEKKWLT